LPADHSAWVLETHYLALAVSTWVCTLSPKRIVLGGGVMQRDFLFPMIREQVRRLLNNYIPKREMLEELDKFLVPPQLGNHSGVLGAILLAKELDLQGLKVSRLYPLSCRRSFTYKGH
jgi:fructokinase